MSDTQALLFTLQTNLEWFDNMGILDGIEQFARKDDSEPTWTIEDMIDLELTAQGAPIIED